MSPWEVIEDVLVHKKPRRSLQWLAEQLEDTKIQVVMNWKTRGVPPRRYREVAAALGITIDQLEGLEPLPWSKEFEWPFSVQLHERIQQLKTEEVLTIEMKVWEQLKERAPAVVEAQLNKARSLAPTPAPPMHYDDDADTKAVGEPVGRRAAGK